MARESRVTKFGNIVAALASFKSEAFWFQEMRKEMRKGDGKTKNSMQALQDSFCTYCNVQSLVVV